MPSDPQHQSTDAALMPALRHVAQYGSLVGFPCRETQVPILFAEMRRRGWTQLVSGRTTLTRKGREALSHG